MFSPSAARCYRLQPDVISLPLYTHYCRVPRSMFCSTAFPMRVAVDIRSFKTRCLETSGVLSGPLSVFESCTTPVTCFCCEMIGDIESWPGGRVACERDPKLFCSPACNVIAGRLSIIVVAETQSFPCGRLSSCSF